MSQRIIAIIHDGDCSDCSCEHLSVAPDLNLDDEKTAYNKWYREVYSAQRTSGDSFSIGYRSFTKWLIDRGAKWADIEEVSSS